MHRTHLVVLWTLFVVALLPAQPPAPLNPQAPTLAALSATGVRVGSSVDLTLTGTNLAEPVAVWTSFPAKATIPADAGNGKAPTTFKVRLDVPKDAAPGFHTVRVVTRKGTSNARLFCLDDLPEVAEVATNRDVKTAQPVAYPAVVSGKADAEVADYFKVTVKAGQRLSFEVLGRRLGSGFDPQLTLMDATGRELPGGHSNDAPGLQTDARLTYTFKAAGDYVVAVRDVSWRGGADFNYRLRVGDFPCATTPLPLAVKRGSKTKVSFTGPQVAGVAPVEVAAPADAWSESVQVTPRSAEGVAGWPVILHLSDLDEAVEKEPNNDPKTANRLAVPGAVTGRFEEKDDIDHYVFALKKGQRVAIEASAAEHLSPTDVLLTLRDAKGAQLAASNPQNAPRLDYTAPADGDFTLAVEHLHAWGGPDEVYRVTVVPFAGDFGLTLNADRYDVPAGGTVSIPIFATRAGYDGPIEVSVVGAKGVAGTVTITGPVKPLPQPTATLVVKADDLPPGPLGFRIVGKATVGGTPVTRLANHRALVVTAMGGLAVPPRDMTTLLVANVTEKPPITVTLKLDAPTFSPGKPAPATITVTRTAGFTGEVAVAFTGLPPGTKVDPAAVKIPAAQTAVKVTLTVPANVKVAPYQVGATATAKHAGKDWSAVAAAQTLTVKK